MYIREIREEKYRQDFDRLALHPLQSWEWGDFRAQTEGVKVVRYGIFEGELLVEPVQITIHRLPGQLKVAYPWSVGYCPKSGLLQAEHKEIFAQVAKQYKCTYIKCEPKVETTHPQFHVSDLKAMGFMKGRSLFTKYNFVLDVSPSEEELLASFKQKTRYNIRVAEKRGVSVGIDNSPEAFEKYLQLTEETTERQGFYAHGREYHRKMWETLHKAGIAQLLVAKYNGEIITTWVLFRFNDTLYYPYGASTREHREVMANNLVMWEAIKLAKRWGLHYLDMWGALGPEPKLTDPWIGFHTFKSGYGARHVEYIGTWDYIAQPALYYPLIAAEWVRWKILRLRKGS